MRHRLTAGEIRLWLVRAGLDPRALSVANVAAGQVAALVGGVADCLVQNGLAMEQADRALAAARSSVERLEQRVRMGQATPDELQRLAAARSALTSAQAQVQDHVAAVFAAATAGLAADARNALQVVQRNRGKGAPLEFALVDRAEADWVGLRDALAARTQAQRSGRDLPANAARIAANATSPAVADAARRLRDGLPATQAAWDQAVDAAQGR